MSDLSSSPLPPELPIERADVADGQPPAPPRRPSKLLVLIPVIATAMVLSLVTVPYLEITPGPTRDVFPLIKISGTTVYPTDGHLLLTAVNLRQANVYDLVAAWLDPTAVVVPERDVFAPGQTQQEEAAVARSQMDTSKIDAAIVALSRYANYPKANRPGALVEQVFDGTPAAGRLFPGDVIAEAGGRTIRGPDDLGAAIATAGAGHPLRLTVRGRPGGTVDVTVSPTRVPKVDHPVIGVSVVHNFPFPLTIQSGDIGGPSAGLMWTLGLSDLLTPGALAGGRTIAGTGEIDASGRVYPIGGVQEKVVSAERAGATVFFVPQANAADARSVARTATIVPVRTFDDALRYLQGSAR